MKIHSFNQAPTSNADFICRQSRFWAIFGFVFAIIWSSIGVFLILAKKDAFWIGSGFIALGALYGIAMFRRTLMVYSSANWLLRWDGQRMLIRLAPTYSKKMDGIFAVEIPRSEIASVRWYQFTSMTKGSNGSVSDTSRHLEIQTAIPHSPELMDHVRLANAPIKWKGFTASTVPAVTLPSDQTIRIAWMNTTCIVTPGLKKTLAFLGRDLKILEQEIIVADSTRDEKDLKIMDDQILAAAQAGKTIEAIKLARKRYGFSLTEAKQFVDELQNPTAK